MREPTDVLARQRRDLPALTGIRFFAAWYVVLFHALPGLARRYPVPKLLATFLRRVLGRRPIFPAFRLHPDLYL
jgi:peptidoglycan/LPS O-acetylase OafA/YrhL